MQQRSHFYVFILPKNNHFYVDLFIFVSFPKDDHADPSKSNSRTELNCEAIVLACIRMLYRNSQRKKPHFSA